MNLLRTIWTRHRMALMWVVVLTALVGAGTMVLAQEAPPIEPAPEVVDPADVEAAGTGAQIEDRHTVPIPWIWWVAPIGSIIALIFAWVFFKQVKRSSPGDADMQRIAQYVTDGAYAYLKRQYKVVAIFFAVASTILFFMGWFGLQHQIVFIAFLTGGFFSGLCGFLGMKTATLASNRTTQGAKEGLNRGLTVAFRAGAVMGLVVVGFGLLDITVWFLILTKVAPIFGAQMSLVQVTVIMLTFGLGASAQALFARVGGGIYTKAADVGADLVGKVEAGIPEDDPRNPATIADNVGDNVGDVAGMGADLYESYCGSILATAALGVAAGVAMELPILDQVRLLAAPMVLAGIGILLSIIGIYMVRTREGASMKQLMGALSLGVNGSSVGIVIVALFVTWMLLGPIEAVSHWGIWGAIVSGLLAGIVIGKSTEFYTSYDYKPTRGVCESSKTGPATVIISGTALGMKSTWVPLATIIVAILAAYTLAGGAQDILLGLYGVGIAAVGLLATLGITLATDAYGPIADNAGGNAEMTHQDPEVRRRTDALDSLGNTTAAVGKGFAIGSAALTALALLAAYVEEVRLGQNHQAESFADRQMVDNQEMKLVLIADATRRWDAEAAYRQTMPPAQQGMRGLRATGQEDWNTVQVAYIEHNKVALGRIEPTLQNPEIAGGMLLNPRRYRHYTDLWRMPDGSPRMITYHATGEDNIFRATVYADGPNAGQTVDPDNVLEGTVAELRMVPTPIASLPQYMEYYNVTMMNPQVLCGIFAGVMLVFLFSAMTMEAVGRAAQAMVQEVRRQFREIKGIMTGEATPDYARCVAISTAGAQREMIIPSLLALTVPIIVGLFLDVAGVLGLLAGGLSSGFAMAIYMANAGGAWDNAKKFIETGQFGGKGSENHKACVTGDTVGDPFKDTSGPSLNILIKLISMVSVVFAGVIVQFAPRIGALLGFN